MKLQKFENIIKVLQNATNTKFFPTLAASQAKMLDFLFKFLSKLVFINHVVDLEARIECIVFDQTVRAPFDLNTKISLNILNVLRLVAK